MFWVEHLEQMDYLRSSVNLRAYGQRDPLVEYKREGLQMFKQMEASIEQMIEENLKKFVENQKISGEQMRIQNQAMRITNNSPKGTLSSLITREETNKEHKDIGRNDPCWCGSGKKFKKCHGANL